MCEGLVPLRRRQQRRERESVKKKRRTHMAFPLLQLFNCLDPHPLEGLSSPHGYAESGLAAAYLLGCAPIPNHSTWLRKADTIVAHIPSKSCCHLAVTHPSSGEAKCLEKHYLRGRKKAVWAHTTPTAVFSCLSPTQGGQWPWTPSSHTKPFGI